MYSNQSTLYIFVKGTYSCNCKLRILNVNYVYEYKYMSRQYLYVHTCIHMHILECYDLYISCLPTYVWYKLSTIYVNICKCSSCTVENPVLKCMCYYSGTGESVACMCTHSNIDWPHWVFSTGVINIIMYVRTLLHNKYVSIINVHMYVLEQ